MRKCLHESGQALPYFRFLLGQLGDWEPKDDFTDVTAFDLHCILYVKRPELVPKALAFADEVTDEVALSEIPNRATDRVLGDVETSIELLREQGFEVIAVDITTPDIEDVGLKVVRVVIPGLVPLHGNHNWPYLGASRLYEAPRRLGWKNPDGPLNPYPHPFP